MSGNQDAISFSHVKLYDVNHSGEYGEKLITKILMEASSDVALSNNSVPPLSAREEVMQWIRESGWFMWAVTVNDVPVGYIAVHEPDLTEDSEQYCDYWEVDYYLLPAYRGKRIIQQAWKLLLELMPADSKYVAEIWETNTSSIASVERDGWEYVGRYFWSNSVDPKDSGWCVRYVYP